MPVVVVNRITAKDKESFNRIVEAFKHRSHMVEDMEGFMGVEVLVNEEDMEVLVLTRWRDLESFKRWVESEEFKKAHSGERTSGINAESEGKVYITLES